MTSDTTALLAITIIIGFLIYFISFKFLLHIVVAVSAIIILPIYFSFNPLLFSMPDFQFFALVMNGLVYTVIGIVVDMIFE